MIIESREEFIGDNGLAVIIQIDFKFMGCSVVCKHSDELHV